MSKRATLTAVSAMALAAGSVYYLKKRDDAPPPVMNPTGESRHDGVIVKRRTVDYETLLRSAAVERASLIVLTLKGDLVRDQLLENSIRFTPFPSSRARVRVKYHVEYPIGFPLEPGDFTVSREGGRLVFTVKEPELVARPSVRLLGYEVLESGILVDEKTAVIELQRRLQPEAEVRGRRLLARSSVRARGERVLTRFLSGILAEAAGPGVEPPPPLVVRYR